MLIPGATVHGIGMKEPLLVVGLDAGERVVGLGTLLPGRVVWIRKAKQMLELPAALVPPPEGAVLTWVSGGPPDSVRNTHRQSR
jgi:hypothetical protein